MQCVHLRRAATSVDLLTAGTSILIGIALLVPGLARAREGQNAAACARNLKQLGYGISMYVADQGGYLPGPTTVSVPFNSAAKYLANKDGPEYYAHTLTSFVSPYVGGGASADRLAFCPTADSIPVASDAGQKWFYQPRLYYVLNSFYTGGIGLVKYRTSPICYFGLTNLGQDYWPLPHEIPKPLDRVANPSREWMLADVWYWEAAPPRGAGQMVGTWGYPVARDNSSRIYYNGFRVPTYPFHNTTQTFSPEGSDILFGSPRLTAGQTNTVYFDGHTAGVRNWTGSVNPCTTGLCY